MPARKKKVAEPIPDPAFSGPIQVAPEELEPQTYYVWDANGSFVKFYEVRLLGRDAKVKAQEHAEQIGGYVAT